MSGTKPLLMTDLGIGFRPFYYRDLLAYLGPISCLEMMTDDYLDVGGASLSQLHALHERYPLVFHGVSLSLASDEPLNVDYVKKVGKLADKFSAVHVSEHLCWTSIEGRYSFDLLPFPWNERSLSHLIFRVNQIQDILQRQLVLENLSQYIAFKESTMTESEFWIQLINCTGCGMLLDVNNVYVNAQNFGYIPNDFLNAIPAESVKQYHLAGHRMQNSLCVDTHDTVVAPSVHALYREAWARAPAPTILERDDELPVLAKLEEELVLIKQSQDRQEVVCP